ncbi:thioredoxin fold domain-containing protein [Flavobacteriaceae bacterium Ap0902]|nr:thioredoxin fold domain-containing protein [Flavobacteriaceae bacterium Ap0902]
MILGSLVLSSHCFSQLKEYSFPEIDSLQQVEPRKTVVFIHTSWCTYCSMMNKSVFGDEKIADILNEKYYYVPLDAEGEKNIDFAGKTFKFIPNGMNTGIHELATALGTIDGKLSYPTLVILNEKYEIVFQYGGLLDRESVKEILLN